MKARRHRPLRSGIIGNRTQRLGEMPQPPGGTHVGVAWYQREQWARLRELAADAPALEEYYDEWVASAERTLTTVKAQGLTVERVTVDVDEMAEWCRRAGRPFDSEARSEYVADLMRRHDSQA